MACPMADSRVLQKGQLSGSQKVHWKGLKKVHWMADQRAGQKVPNWDELKARHLVGSWVAPKACCWVGQWDH